jgi:RNase P/RNase MRP subunit p29
MTDQSLNTAGATPTDIPALPEGFTLDVRPAAQSVDMSKLPPLPDGFTIDQPSAVTPKLPDGFTLDKPEVKADEKGFFDRIGQPVTDPKQYEAMAAAQGVGPLNAAKNILAGMGERVFDLVGGFGDLMATTAPKYDPAHPYPYGSGDIKTELQKTSKDIHDVSFGYTPKTTWDDVKKSPISTFVPFAVEQGLVSAPDMAAVLLNLPGYVAMRTGELGKQRSENNQEKEPTVQDMLATMPAATVSALLDRIGAKGMFGLDEVAVQSLKQLPKEAGKAALKEGATEAGQQVVEDVGTDVGTKKGFDPARTAENALASAVGGLVVGGMVRGTEGATELGEHAKPEVATADLPPLPEGFTLDPTIKKSARLPAEGKQGEAVETVNPPDQAPVTRDGSEDTVSPPDASLPSISPEERAILRRTAIPDDDIDAMSREEVAQKVSEAKAANVRVNGAMVRAAEQYRPAETVQPVQAPQVVQTDNSVPALPQGEAAPIPQPRPVDLSPDVQSELAKATEQSVAADRAAQIDQAVNPEVQQQLAQTVEQPIADDMKKALDLQKDTNAVKSVDQQKVTDENDRLRATRDARLFEDANVQQLVKNEGSLSDPVKQGLSTVRGEGNNRPSGMDNELRGVPPIPRDEARAEIFDRQDRRDEGIRARERALGNTQDAVSEPANVRQEPAGEDSSAGGVRGEHSRSDSVQSPSARDERGSGAQSGKTENGISTENPSFIQGGDDVDTRYRKTFVREFQSPKGKITERLVFRKGDNGKRHRQTTWTNENGNRVSRNGDIKKPDSLIEFLARKGGVKDDRGELRVLGLRDRKSGFVVGAGPLIRRNGMNPDTAREAAAEAGYLPMESSLADFYNALDQDARSGRTAFSQYDDDWAHAWREGQGGEANGAEQDAAHSEAYSRLKEDGFPVDEGGDFINRVAAHIGNGQSYENAVEQAYLDIAAAEPALHDIPFFESDNAAQSGTTLAGSEAGREEGQQRDRSSNEVSTEADRQAGPARGEAGTQAASVRSQQDSVTGDQQSATQRKESQPQEPVTERGADNKPQLVIPGAERASDATMAQRGADAALKPKTAQKEPGGLFSDDLAQKDLLDYSSAPAGWDFADAGDPMPGLTEVDQKKLAEIVRRTAGIDPSFMESIKVPAGTKALAAWGNLNEDSTAGGFYANLRDAITLALDTAPVRGAKVAYHESFHRLQNLFLNEKERKLLKDDEARLRQMIADKGEYSKTTVERMSRKEVEAEAFGLWAAAKDAGEKTPPVRSVIRRAWQNISDMLRRVKNYLNGRGFQTSEDVFGKARKGDIAKRPKRESTSTATEYALADDRAPAAEPTRTPEAALGNRITDQLKAASKALAAKAKSKGSKFDRANQDDGETFAQYSHRKIVDYLSPVKQMQEKVGGNLNDLSDAYLNARLAEGTIRHEIHQIDEKYVSPAVDELARVGASLEDLHRYMYAMHVPERNRVVGLRNEEGSQLYKAATDPSVVGASGMSVDQARETIRELQADREKFIGVRRAASHIRAMLDNGLKAQLRGGLINKATYDRLTSQWSNYVPLRAESDTDGNGGGMPSKSKGFDVRGDEFKGATGRYSPADNVVVYAVNNAEQSVIRVEKNKAATAALRFINEFDPQGENIAQVYWSDQPDQLGDITKAPPVYKRTLDKDGKVVQKQVNSFHMKDDVLAAKVGGKTYYMKFADPKVGLALKKMTFSELGVALKLVKTVSNWQSLINTRANPAFIPLNMLRDIQTGATLALSKDFKVHEIAKMVGDIPNAWGALWRQARGKEANGVWDAKLNDFMSSGGKTSFDQYNSIEDTLKKLQKDMANRNQRGVASKSWHSFIKLVEDLNDTIENGMRLSVFNASRARGETSKRAAFLARDLTVDFQKKGEITPSMNALYTFFNASVQGNYNFAKGLAKSKKVRAAMIGMMAAGFAQHLWNLAMAGNDDDGENAYKKMLRNEPWKFERQMVFFLPGRKDYITIPLGFGLNAFWHLGMQGGAVTTGDKGFLSAALDSTRVAFDAFNPLGSGGWISTILPSIIDPIWELGTNEDFTGRPIYPTENKFDPAPPPKSQTAYGSTGPAFKWAADKMSRMTGGNDKIPGAVDVYPASLEYLWGWFTGGVGRFASQTVQTAQNAADLTFEPKKTPFVRSFYGSVDDSSKKAEYYTEREKVQYAKGKLKEYQDAGNKQDTADFVARNKHDIDAINVFDIVESQRKKLNKERRALEKSKMPQDKIDNELDRLNDIELEIMNQARTQYFKLGQPKENPTLGTQE